MFYINSHKRQALALLISFIFFGSACKKLLEVDPPFTSYTAANAYSNDATAIAVLTGIYANLGDTYGTIFATGPQSISLFTGLSGDEFTLYPGVTNTTYISYYRNALSANNIPAAGSEYWSEIYNKIFICNSVLEGLNSSSGVTAGVKQQLLGEAKFMRAFFYFYLVNLFGDVPLATSTNYKTNSILSRTPRAKIYEQITEDLKDATSLLSPDYLNGNLQKYTDVPERLRPTKWAAIALLARAYLYNGDYSNALAQSTLLINNSSLFKLIGLNNTFLKNNDEAIWQLQPVNTSKNTEEAFIYILPESGPSDNNPVYLSPYLLNSFETNDKRKINWINTLILGTDTLYYPYKYKSATLDAPVTEYLIVLRLAEQFLIRAEARAQTGDLSGGAEDLNFIRTRADLPKIADNVAASKTLLLDAILHERQVELFTEWGHRWLDLKRTGKVNTVMAQVTPKKGGVWNTNWQWYPILRDDIRKNANITQNTGY